MEKQPKAKKNGALKKLAFVLGAVALLLAAMGVTVLVQQSLRPARPTPAVTEAPTETPEPTPLPDRNYDSEKKPDFMPELDKLGLVRDKIDDYGPENFAPEFWLDITPDDLRSAAGCTVIRHIGLGYSYLIKDGVYYRLGEGDDGKGVLDVILCDLNFDEMPDVLYTYHYGTSDDAQTKIGWFDFATGQSKLSPFASKGAFLALNEEEGHCVVYRCERFVDEEYGFSLRFTDRIGEVVEIAGELFLVME